MKIEIIRISRLIINEHHLDISYSADEFNFSTKIFYHDISFSKLQKQYSASIANKIAAHIALFEGMKLCSLFPQYYDVSLIAENLSPSALELFSQVYSGVFAQHLYENQRADYTGPEIIYANTTLGNSNPVSIVEGDRVVLAGCGGGKDSILAMKMLQEAEIPFASMQYSHSVYGKAEHQHHLISSVLDCTTPIRQHKISIYDDFIDNPFLKLYFPENSGITVPETPVSIFESLFLALYWGYEYLSLAHEKSANTGNLFWQELGREVNHQWGKSYEAEILLNSFIQNNLLLNFTYFSILQPIYDWRIFKNLARYPEVIPRIHSCNLQKPWCKKCPKCAYVWLGLMAAFDPALVNAVFQKNLLDDEDLLPTFREMLGLSIRTPFECIGEVNESRLAMKKCWEKGLSGRAIDVFKQEILSDSSINWREVEQKYNRIYEVDCAIPEWIFERIKAKL